MENVWAYLRSNKPAVSVFDTYEEILEKCAQAWNFCKTRSNIGPQKRLHIAVVAE